MNLLNWIKTPGAIAEYRAWLANPITQIMIEGIRDLNRSARLANPTGEAALQELGFRAARDNDLLMLERLDEFIEEDSGEDTAVRNRVEYLVRNEGWSPEEAKDIVSKGEDLTDG